MNVQNVVGFPELAYKLITFSHKDLVKEFGPGEESRGLAFKVTIIDLGTSLESTYVTSCLVDSTGTEEGKEHFLLFILPVTVLVA